MNRALVFGSMVLPFAVVSEALAYVGQDPIIRPAQCNLTQVTAEYGPDASIRYSFLGTCNSQPVTGEARYANQQMAERFYYQGAQLNTSARCPADPWVTGATCEDQKVAAKGADPGSLIYEKAPLSRRISDTKLFQDAKANATRPKPPGPPVNAHAKMKSIQNAIVYWLGPEQQGNYGPYLNFIVEARPQKAEGAAWTKLGGIARHSDPNYKLSVRLPPAPEGGSGWELRACATTAFNQTCTSPIVPTIAPDMYRLGPGLERAKTPPPVTTEVNSARKSITPQIGSSQNSPSSEQGTGNAASAPLRSFGKAHNTSPANNAALNPQPLPPKSFGKIQSPSPGSNAALNPQPLPPKVFSFGRVMGRGVPEGEAAPDDTPPVDPTANDSSNMEAAPSQASPIGVKPEP